MLLLFECELFSSSSLFIIVFLNNNLNRAGIYMDKQQNPISAVAIEYSGFYRMIFRREKPVENFIAYMYVIA